MGSSLLCLVDDIVVNVGVKIELLSLMEAKCPDVLGSAAAAGDVGTLNSYLRKNPLEVHAVLYYMYIMYISIMIIYIMIRC